MYRVKILQRIQLCAFSITLLKRMLTYCAAVDNHVVVLKRILLSYWCDFECECCILGDHAHKGTYIHIIIVPVLHSWEIFNQVTTINCNDS